MWQNRQHLHGVRTLRGRVRKMINKSLRKIKMRFDYGIKINPFGSILKIYNHIFFFQISPLYSDLWLTLFLPSSSFFSFQSIISNLISKENRKAMFLPVILTLFNFYPPVTWKISSPVSVNGWSKWFCGHWDCVTILSCSWEKRGVCLFLPCYVLCSI